MFHNTNRTKHNAKIQTKQDTNMTKYKNSKIQTGQNTTEQNTNCQSTNVTKYKYKKIQIEQNPKTPKYKHDKIQKDKIQIA